MYKQRIEKLDYAELWLRDGLSVIDPPGGLLAVEVDMSQANDRRTELRRAGTAVTYTHIVIHAVAAVLTENSDLHRLVAGSKRLIPNTVDLCLSIAGDDAVTPVLIIKDAGRKSLEEIAGEVRARASQEQLANRGLLDKLRKWGWLLPGSFLRRSLIRSLLKQLWYRRNVSGTFQVTFIPTVDLCVPFLFNTVAALSAGTVRERVVAVNGKIELRPILTLCCCFDHKVWNGLEAARFINGVKQKLEHSL